MGVRQGITSHRSWCLYYCVSSPTEDSGITISLVTCYSCHRFISICQAGTHAVCFVWHDCACYLAKMAPSPQASTYHRSWCWCWDLLINLSWITKISSLTHIFIFNMVSKCLEMPQHDKILLHLELLLLPFWTIRRVESPLSGCDNHDISKENVEALCNDDWGTSYIATSTHMYIHVL